jgi:uncharacterized protein
MNSNNIYKGISFPFRFNSQGRVEKSELTHDDFSRIKESIIQILFTFKMERIMLTDFGSTRGAIFDPLDDMTDRALLKHEIQQAIEKYEDRVDVNNVEVYTDESKEGTLIVVLDLHIVKFVKDVSLTLPMDLNNYLGGGF